VKTILIFIFTFVIPLQIYSQELVISGLQDSRISCVLEQKISIPDGMKRITVSFVEPADFDSRTYTQAIKDLRFAFSLKPDSEKREKDRYDNRIRRFSWDSPQGDISVSVSLNARIRVKLDSVRSETGYPLSSLPQEYSVFLEPTSQVQSDNPELAAISGELTRECKTQIEAVRSILHYTVDHLCYTLVPEKFDALYAYRAGSGNCQNYSHLAAALLRASGIPARIVNGLTFRKNFSIPVGQAEYSFEMADGRHSWIEVYFPDMGWLPFDAQQSEYFVSNRYLRIEVGRDNNETIQDGLVKWITMEQGKLAPPALEEQISSDFLNDDVTLAAGRKIAGLKKLLLTPPVYAGISPPILVQAVTPSLTKPTPDDSGQGGDSARGGGMTEPDFTRMTYQTPFVYGNLDFPRRFDFLSARLPERAADGSSGELKRSFVVETAEYVTGKKQYSQIFVLMEPVSLEKISLALHSFGGNGFLWLELSEDDDGEPGERAASSNGIAPNRISHLNGYDWVDFDFSGEGLILSPGKYWFTLNYSGSPIVNWFYTYGKSVGPVEGTRSRNIGQSSWNTVQSYEFNYRIKGAGTEGYQSKP